MQTGTDSVHRGKIIINDITIDFQTPQVLIGKTRIHLSPLQFNIFAYLVCNRNRFVTTKELLANVWETQYGTTDQVRGGIKRLRNKLKKGKRGYENCIYSERGWGYRFIPMEKAKKSE